MFLFYFYFLFLFGLKGPFFWLFWRPKPKGPIEILFAGLNSSRQAQINPGPVKPTAAHSNDKLTGLMVAVLSPPTRPKQLEVLAWPKPFLAWLFSSSHVEEDGQQLQQAVFIAHPRFNVMQPVAPCCMPMHGLGPAGKHFLHPRDQASSRPAFLHKLAAPPISFNSPHSHPAQQPVPPRLHLTGFDLAPACLQLVTNGSWPGNNYFHHIR